MAIQVNERIALIDELLSDRVRDSRALLLSLPFSFLTIDIRIQVRRTTNANYL